MDSVDCHFYWYSNDVGVAWDPDHHFRHPTGEGYPADYPIWSDGNLSLCLLPRPMSTGEEGELSGGGEGGTEDGEGPGGEGEPAAGHSADQNNNGHVEIGELLRVVQLYNAGAFQCGTGTEDGFDLGDVDYSCTYHSSDYQPPSWTINLTELLRAIQFYVSGGFRECPETEDGFCAEAR